MAMTPEMRKALALSGVSPQQIMDMERQAQTTQSEYDAIQAPEGQKYGKFYQAASPLSHLATGLNRVRKRREQREDEGKHESALATQAKGRTAASDFLSGLGKGEAEDYQAGIRNIEDEQLELLQMAGHADPVIAAQAKSALALSKDRIGMVYKQARNTIEDERKDFGMGLQERRADLESQRYDLSAKDFALKEQKFEEEKHQFDMGQKMKRAELEAAERGDSMNLGDGEKATIMQQQGTLNGILDSINSFEDGFAQQGLVGISGMDVNLPISDLLLTFARKDLPGTTDEMRNAAKFYGKWALQYTLGSRNELFGATLTPSEAAAWKAASELDPDSPAAYQREVMADLKRATQARIKFNAQTHIAGGEATTQYFDDLYGKEWRGWGSLSAADKDVINSGVPTPEDLSYLDDPAQGSTASATQAPTADGQPASGDEDYNAMMGEGGGDGTPNPVRQWNAQPQPPAQQPPPQAPQRGLPQATAQQPPQQQPLQGPPPPPAGLPQATGQQQPPDEDVLIDLQQRIKQSIENGRPNKLAIKQLAELIGIDNLPRPLRQLMGV